MTHERPLAQAQEEGQDHVQPKEEKDVVTTEPPPSFDVTFGDQISMLTQSVAVDINVANLKSILDTYLEVSQVTEVFNAVNPNPVGSGWTNVGEHIILVSSQKFDFKHAVQICLTLGGSIFGPSTDDHVTFIAEKASQPIWVSIEKLRGSTTFYAYSQTQELPVTLKEVEVSYDITGEPECVTFNFTTMKFKTTECTKSRPVACQLPNEKYLQYKSQLETQTFILERIRDLSTWYEDLGGDSLLSTDNLPVASCRGAIPVFSDTYGPLPTQSFPKLSLSVQRFITKFNWIQKLLHGLKLLRSKRILSTLGFALSATREDNLCISWNFPVFPAWTKNLFSFSITDICLASATVSVALLSACLTYKAFRRDSHAHHHPVYAYTTTPPPSPSLHDFEMVRPSRSVSFANNLDNLPETSRNYYRRPSISPPPSPAQSSLGPLKYYGP